jgi:hypothetical protein
MSALAGSLPCITSAGPSYSEKRGERKHPYLIARDGDASLERQLIAIQPGNVVQCQVSETDEGGDMSAVERIQQYVQRLPQRLQAEVLDFVEYLLTKVEREAAQPEEMDWSPLSLAFAMRGMEDEDVPAYSVEDLKVVYSS